MFKGQQIQLFSISIIILPISTFFGSNIVSYI